MAGLINVNRPTRETYRRLGLRGGDELLAWGEVFGDRVIAIAILDRLLHHAVTLNIRGNSYRLKEKLTAVLVRSE